MENQGPLKKLNELAQVDTSWQDDFLFYKNNKTWLDYSAEIAIQILSALRKNRRDVKYPATQKDLAEILGISPQQISKIVKGNENLTLETISRLEKALAIQLIDVYRPADKEVVGNYTHALVAEDLPAYGSSSETTDLPASEMP